MKTKTPEEIIAKFHLDKANLEFIAENCFLNGTLYADIKAAMYEYHTQFATSSEEFERAKTEFIAKYAVMGHFTECLDDLDTLLAMRREEKWILFEKELPIIGVDIILKSANGNTSTYIPKSQDSVKWCSEKFVSWKPVE